MMNPQNTSLPPRQNHNLVLNRSRRNRARNFISVAKCMLMILCWTYALIYVWITTDESGVFRVSMNNNFESILLTEALVTNAANRHNKNNGIEAQKSHHESDTSVLPEALHPITFHDCCTPAIMNGTAHPKDLQCFGTCYNQRACHDPSYPYSSQEERETFGTLVKYNKPNSLEANMTKRRCFVEPQWLVPNVTWCSKPTRNEMVYGDTPSPGCSILSDAQGGPWQHVFVFPRAKLAFCGIPKVGITQWIQFARFVAGAKDYPSIPHYKLDIDFFRYDKMDPSIQREIWSKEQEWTWATFVRDPAERVLSAYLDKIDTPRGQDNVRRIHGFDGDYFTFEDFVKRLTMTYNRTGCYDKALVKDRQSGMTGLNLCSNPHWRPQVMSCGLHARLDRFKFIGDIHNIAENTKHLLQEVNLWESHGKYFINGGITKEGTKRLHDCSIKSHRYSPSKHLGFQQRNMDGNSTAANTAYGHSTGSKEKMAKYYTPELLMFVREKLYADDYKLYQLVSAKKTLSNGKELASQLSGSYCRHNI